MRIVCVRKEDSHRIGLMAAFEAAGIENIFWNPQHKAAYDMYFEVKPDLLVLHQTDVSPEIQHLVHEFNLPVHLLNPDGYYANLAQFGKGVFSHRLESDYLYFSFLPPKDEQVKFLAELAEQGRLKCFGHIPLNMPNYLGILPPAMMADALYSTKCVVDFDGSMTLTAFALNKRVLGPDGDIQPTTEQTQLALSMTYFDLAADIMMGLNQPELERQLIEKKAVYV